VLYLSLKFKNREIKKRLFLEIRNIIQTYWAIRREDFNRIARTKISQFVGMVSTSIIVGLILVVP